MESIPMQTVFTRMVKPVPATPTKSTKLFVLKPANANTKLGDGARRFTKGPWKGMPLFTLTLEERKTCPATCDQLVRCYGNGMHLAVRYEHGAALEAALAEDVAYLAAKHPTGFVVRTHVLGDFYSTEYVQHWAKLVRQHQALHIYGYTHREYGTAIGDEVARLVGFGAGRVRILRSNGFHAMDPLPRAVVIPARSTEAHPATDVICPQQTEKTASCMTCGLCMNGRTTVSFLDHGKTPHQLIALGRRQSAA